MLFLKRLAVLTWKIIPIALVLKREIYYSDDSHKTRENSQYIKQCSSAHKYTIKYKISKSEFHSYRRVNYSVPILLPFFFCILALLVSTSEAAGVSCVLFPSCSPFAIVNSTLAVQIRRSYTMNYRYTKGQAMALHVFGLSPLKCEEGLLGIARQIDLRNYYVSA